MRLPRLLLLFTGLFTPLGLPESSHSAEPDRFSREVAPILAKRCLECHSENEPSGKLILSLKAAALQGGESGPAIVPRDVEKSQLLARVTAGEMPPPKRGHSQKLPDAEIKILRDWIASGADWPDGRKLDLYESTSDVRAGRDWWSLQPVTKSRVPSVESREQAKNGEALVPSPPPVFGNEHRGERARVRGPSGDKASSDSNGPILPPSPRRGGPGRGDDQQATLQSPVNSDQAAPLPNPPRRGEGTRESENRRPPHSTMADLAPPNRAGTRESENRRPPLPSPLPPKAGGEGTKPKTADTESWPSSDPQPSPLDPQLTRSPIDAFIVARLQGHQMEPAPPADRRTLIKRVSFDLLGLPPSFEEVETFVSDPAPDAYERLVDRLLASPHFGERWARHWLDLVRYADTSGYERDQEKPGAWKYRDWVVRAINEDLPYSRFIIEQLAGDELPDRTEGTLIATGFLRLGTWNDEPNDAEEYKYDRLEDLVGTTSTAFLGYTIKCARCHDHKFDPIQQADYYRMAAAFWPGAIEQRGRELLGGPSREELDATLGSPPSAVSPSNKPLMPDILAWTDIRPAPPIHLLRKGEPKQPREVIKPAAMSC